jgi:hypothetical protein
MVLFAWAALTRDAHAIDGVRPRTPVLWPDDVPCLVEVDRTIDPIVNLPYAIPFEDPPAGESITDDEVSDGRRHQFLAFSQDIDPRLALPPWISWDDIMRAALLGLVDPATVQPDAVLDGHPVLGDIFVRIEPDDARRPITFDAAMMGADWDTSPVAAGTYVLRGYTWDPWPNFWAAPRRGVVRVYDDVDDPTLVPALAIGIDDTSLYRDQIGTITGCLAAPPGTTLSAAWADFTDEAGAYTTFVEDVIADDGVVAIELVPPEALWGGFAAIRVTAIDPSGLRYDAFVPERITILASATPCQEGCGTSSDDGNADSTSGDGTSSSPAETSGSGPASTTMPSEGTSSGAPETPSETHADGCGCGAPSAASPLMLCVLLLRRRRQS